jgi:hypothetical protein
MKPLEEEVLVAARNYATAARRRVDYYVANKESMGALAAHNRKAKPIRDEHSKLRAQQERAAFVLRDIAEKLAYEQEQADEARTDNSAHGAA